MTAQPHPRAAFYRAIARANLRAAEEMVREMGIVSLAESLSLTALAAFKGSPRRSAYTVRWLRRLLEEDPNLTIDDRDTPPRARGREVSCTYFWLGQAKSRCS